MVSITRPRARNPEDAASGEDMESRLLDALERMLQKGESFTSVSVERLSREAGISRATFYLYFRDKSDLIRRLMNRIEDEVVAAGGMWFLRAEDAGYEDLRGALRRFLDVYRKHRAILQAAAETAAYDDGVDEVYQHMIGRFREESRNAVNRIIAHRRAHAEMPQMLPDVLSWSVDYCYVKFGASMSDDEAEKLIDALTHTVWCAIFEEPRSPAVR